MNHVISGCGKLALDEYKTRNDWVNKVIHWQLCKKFKFDYTNKWYMHNPISLLENDTHKLFGQVTRPYYNQQKKRTCRIVNFAVPADHRVEFFLSEKENKYLELTSEMKKKVEHESDFYTNYNWCSWNSNKGLIKGLEELEIKRRMETIQTTSFLTSARILRRVLET